MKRKRLLFALVAMVSGFWFTAYAQVAKIGETPYATLDEALEYAQAGSIVELVRDITSSEIIVIEKSVTINGNGKTLTSTATRAFNIDTDGEVTINNMTVNAGERAFNIINKPATVELNEVTAIAKNNAVMVATSAGAVKLAVNDCDFTGLAVVNVAGAGAQVTIADTKITNVDANKDENYGAITVWSSANGASVAVTGGEIVIADDSKKAYVFPADATVTGVDEVGYIVATVGDAGFDTLDEALEYAQAGSTVELVRDITASDIITIDKAITLDGNDKTLTSTAARAINVSGAEANGVTIKNLTINASGERAINVIQNATNVTIDNVTATAANYTVNIASSAPNAVVVINNSTLNGLCTVNVSAAGAKVTVDKSTVNCNDNNTTEGEAYAALCLNKDAVGGSIVATNTTVNVAQGSDSMKGRNGAENGKVTINDSTEGVVVMVAVITYDASPYYHSFASLAKAVEFAKAGDVITLIRDITASDIITIDKAITLDGNGKKLTSTAARAINVETDGSVTISNLTINAGERAFNIINKPATVELNGVTAIAKNNAVMVATSAGAVQLAVNDCDFTGLAVVNVAGAGAQVTIADTKITNVDANKDENYGAITVWSSANGASVAVTGGEIVIADDSKKAYVFPADATVTGVDEVGYIVATVGDAGFDTLDEALEYAQAGSTVELVRDITASDIITIDKAITLDGNGKTLTSTAGRAINVSGADGVTIKNLTINANGERAINVIQNATNVTIDNVTATAANYTVNLAGSAPNAVVAINNSTLNGLCTVNVSSEGAKVTVDNSTVNCNDNNTTTGESYAALCLNKEAVGGSIVATNTTVNVAQGSDSMKGRNGAEDGTVTINGSTEGVVVMVAVITYDASPYYHSFASLAKAVEFAKAGDVITLIRDITASDIITIDKAITLDGNGKKLTSTATGTTARAINVSGADGEVIIKNLAIVAESCEEFAVVTDNAGNVKLEECEIEYTRTFAALNTWYALYVPFEISIDAEFLENYDVAKFTGLNVYDNSNMSMSVQLVESGSLEANTPYLIRVKNEEAKTLSVTVNKAGFNSESLTFEDGSITASFSGTYTETVASEIEGAYAMSGGLFRKAADDEQILKPFRFYLMLTDNSTPGQALSLRSVAIRFDNEQDGTTAIEKTQTSEEAIVIYDLTGRRVMEPQEGEIYIINGKKVLF